MLLGYKNCAYKCMIQSTGIIEFIPDITALKN